jgi:hypothetical protein
VEGVGNGRFDDVVEEFGRKKGGHLSRKVEGKECKDVLENREYEEIYRDGPSTVGQLRRSKGRSEREGIERKPKSGTKRRAYLGSSGSSADGLFLDSRAYPW